MHEKCFTKQANQQRKGRGHIYSLQNHLNSPKKKSLRKHNQGEGGNSSGTVSLPSNVKFQC